MEPLALRGMTLERRKEINQRRAAALMSLVHRQAVKEVSSVDAQTHQKKHLNFLNRAYEWMSARLLTRTD